MSDHSPPLRLEMRGIHKSFRGTHAVRGVDFSCSGGEIHGLVGENGAGKSTLMKILAGVHAPDAGTILLNDVEQRFGGYADAREAGIGIVYQELSLLPALTVAENIFMGAWPRGRRGLLDWKRMRRECAAVLEGIGVRLDPDTLVASLPMALRQMVEIGKVLSHDSRLIVFDEPTAPLSRDEVGVLFDVFRDLKRRGKAIVFISHRLDEVLGVCDQITVMKDGQGVSTSPASSFDEEKLIASMVGRRMSEIFPAKPVPWPDAPELFTFDGVLTSSMKRVAFSIRRGEVTGIGGLQGQGQLELLQSIFGVGGCNPQRLTIRGQPVSVRSPLEAMRHGIALVPENRNEEGVFPGLTVLENLTAPTLGKRQRLGLVRRAEERRVVTEMVERLSIRISSHRQMAESLSGGNMQKLVLGKWLVFDPKVIVLLEPTKGVDVATKQEIYRLVRELADRSVAVIVNTSDMLELIGLCDRVLVMNQGGLTGALGRAEISEEAIMKASVSRTDLVQGEGGR